MVLQSASAVRAPDQSALEKHGLPAWQVVNEAFIVTIGYMDVNSLWGDACELC